MDSKEIERRKMQRQQARKAQQAQRKKARIRADAGGDISQNRSE